MLFGISHIFLSKQKILVKNNSLFRKKIKTKGKFLKKNRRNSEDLHCFFLLQKKKKKKKKSKSRKSLRVCVLNLQLANLHKVLLILLVFPFFHLLP